MRIEAYCGKAPQHLNRQIASPCDFVRRARIVKEQAAGFDDAGQLPVEVFRIQVTGDGETGRVVQNHVVRLGGKRFDGMRNVPFLLAQPGMGSRGPGI